MKKRYLSLVLVMMAVAACGGDTSTTTTTGVDDPATETTAGAEGTTATTVAGGGDTTTRAPGESSAPSTTIEPFAMPAEDDVLVTLNGEDIATGDVLTILGEGGAATIEKATFSNALSQLIQFRLIKSAAAEQHQIELPSSDRIDGFLEENFPGQAIEDVAMSAGFPSPAAVTEAVEVTLMIEDFEAKLADPGAITDEAAQTALDAGSLTEICASHILVPTEEEANDAIGRINGGEDFAVVATELSTDTGSGANGGDLGCTNPSTYVPEFAEATLSAEIDELTDPVETQFGFHVIKVTDRTVPNLGEAKQLLAEQNATTQSQQFLEGAFNNAEVEVHLDSLGTWNPAAGGLVPAGGGAVPE